MTDTIRLKQTYLKKLIIITVLLALGACAVHSTKFECEPGKGVGCKSVSKVNKMIDKKQIAEFDEDIFLPGTNLEKEINPGTQKRIWIAPRKAADGSKLNETFIEVY